MNFHIKGNTRIHRIPPIAQRGEALIRRQPVGTLLNTLALAEALGSTPSSVRHWTWAIPAELTVIHRHNKLYGNPKTIKAFKAEYGI